jgi:hypothetical protein
VSQVTNTLMWNRITGDNWYNSHMEKVIFSVYKDRQRSRYYSLCCWVGKHKVPQEQTELSTSFPDIGSFTKCPHTAALKEGLPWRYGFCFQVKQKRKESTKLTLH